MQTKAYKMSKNLRICKKSSIFAANFVQIYKKQGYEKIDLHACNHCYYDNSLHI